MALSVSSLLNSRCLEGALHRTGAQEIFVRGMSKRIGVMGRQDNVTISQDLSPSSWREERDQGLYNLMGL